MNKMNKESFEEFENTDDYKYIRLACSIASMIIYEEDPAKKLDEFSTHQHGIIKESLCVSKTMSEYKKMEKFQYKQIYEDDFDKNISKYLICNHQTSSDSKRLIVAFRGTNNMKDVYADLKAWGKINNHQGRFHSGFYRRAEVIEIAFFFNKLINEGYEIVFTGHSLGAAIAALVAVRVILDHRMTQELAKKVLFIGFGCPLVADNEFKKFLTDRPEYQKRFHFYQNCHDIVVDFLNISSFIVYDSSEFIIEVLFTRSTSRSLYSSFVKQISKALNLAAKAAMPKYRQFGYLLKLEGNKPAEVVDTSEEACIAYIKNLIDNIKTLELGQLTSNVQMHYMNNYFDCIKDIEFKIDKLGKINEAINPLVELPASLDWVAKKSFDKVKIAKEANAYFVEIFKDDIDKSRVIIYLKCANSEYILYNFVELDKENMEYLEPKNFDSQETASGRCFSFHFECSSKDLNNRVKRNLRLYLISSFNYVEIDLTGEIDIKSGSSKRIININSMPIDELYLHAAYYIKLFQTDSSVEKIKESEKIDYEKNCEELKDCFSELNKKWELENKKLSTFKNLCRAYPEYKPIKNSENSESLLTKIIDSETIELFSAVLPSVVMLKTLQAETKTNDDSSIWRVVKYPLYPLLILLKFIHRVTSYWSEQRVKKDEDYRNLVKCLCRDNGFSVELDSDSDQIANAEQFISKNIQLMEKKYKSKEINSN